MIMRTPFENSDAHNMEHGFRIIWNALIEHALATHNGKKELLLFGGMLSHMQNIRLSFKCFIINLTSEDSRQGDISYRDNHQHRKFPGMLDEEEER
ncbi:hypothetical protein CEXT_152561 [Caerostris extrusa]|uniref:Uncharacterized protein n=1 Tax=Caerostris extrusa TaxID=172846 RepID=A0AAV4SER9_CAEEX|nr:hypothetical protein CEXT_152561 [Caerostris extrusa]